MYDFNESSSQFTIGFSAVFNEWSAKAKIKDAENRAEWAHTVKINKAEGQKKLDIAKLVGEKIAEMAIKKGVKEVKFDKGPYKYHGRLKVLADAAREKGLSF